MKYSRTYPKIKNMVRIHCYLKSILPKFIIHHLPFTIFRIGSTLLLPSLLAALPTALAPGLARGESRLSRLDIRKNYYTIVRNYLKKPCASWKALEKFRRRLKTEMTRSKSRRMKRYIRYYLKRARYRIPRYRRRCRNLWKKIYFQHNPRELNPKCRELFSEGSSSPLRTVWIVTEPSSYIYIEEKLCGIAPLRASLPPGEYQLTAKALSSPRAKTAVLSVPAGPKKTPLFKYIDLREHREFSAKKSRKNAIDPIEKTIAKHRKLLCSCKIYSPDTQIVSINFVIDTEGKLAEMTVNEREKFHRRFAECIERNFRKLSFPKPEFEIRLLQYKLQICP